MTLSVHLFGRARDLAGTPRLEVILQSGATVADLRRALTQESPPLAAILERCAVAVNQDFADDDTAVTAGAEVAVIPPVSGGSKP
jgi:molybdopterin converting factor subunit 1